MRRVQRALSQGGFTLFELIFAGIIGLLVGGAVFLSIIGFGYSQTKAEQLAAADMVLTAQSEAVLRSPYDRLDDLELPQSVEQNGYQFELQVDVTNVAVGTPDDIKAVSLSVDWENRLGKSSRGRQILRTKPW